MTIGDKIRFIRDKARNYTQAYVAAQLGITTKAYRNIENNKSDPSYSKLLKIAEILDCDITYIINYDSNEASFHTTRQSTGVTHQAPVEIETLAKMYEDMKRLHAEMLAMSNGPVVSK